MSANPESRNLWDFLRTYKDLLDIHDWDIYRRATESIKENLTVPGQDSRVENAVEWNNRADKLFDLGKYEESLRHYKSALKFDPTNINAWYRIGDALRILGDNEKAIEHHTVIIPVASEIIPYVGDVDDYIYHSVIR